MHLQFPLPDELYIEHTADNAVLVCHRMNYFFQTITSAVTFKEMSKIFQVHLMLCFYVIVCLVYNHVMDVIWNYGVPVVGVYFGTKSPELWSINDLLTKKQAFLAEFAYRCEKKHAIYAKVIHPPF